ncbi:MAG: DUF3781 domain-containing protein [Candidatus Nanoarchaeia archaeon]|nr:DUF3781 domain-containing protein [Candidatus Nanoarchaeia archaeon]
MDKNILKLKIINNICYTELVYERINKKLKTNYSKDEIQEYLLKILKKSDEDLFLTIGKNYYVENKKYNIKITINSNTLE